MLKIWIFNRLIEKKISINNQIYIYIKAIVETRFGINPPEK